MSNQIRNKKIKDNAYICLSAILRAKEARLLTAAQIERMLREREFSAACRVAVEGGYEDMSCMDVSGVNEALARFRAAEVAELSQLVPDNAVLDLFRMKYGYHNAKVLVKSGGDPEKYRDLLSDSARFSMEELLEVYRSDVGDGALPAGYAAAIREARNALARTGNPQLADFILDRAYFAEMLREAGKSRKPYIIDYVRAQIDRANLSSVIRSQKSPRREELLQEALIEGGTIGVEEILHAAESREELLALYAGTDIGQAAAAADPADFELESEIALRRFVREASYIAFGPEVIIEYLSALENEITSLRIILTGILMGLPEEKLRERLRDRYV